MEVLSFILFSLGIVAILWAISTIVFVTFLHTQPKEPTFPPLPEDQLVEEIVLRLGDYLCAAIIEELNGDIWRELIRKEVAHQYKIRGHCPKD